MTSLLGGSGSSTLGTGDIIGIVIGGVLALATVVGLIFSCYAMCCRKNKPPEVYPQQNQYNPNYPPPNGAYGQQANTGYYPQHPPYQQQQMPYPPQQQQQQSWNKPPMANERPPSYATGMPAPNTYGKH